MRPRPNRLREPGSVPWPVIVVGAALAGVVLVIVASVMLGRRAAGTGLNATGAGPSIPVLVIGILVVVAIAAAILVVLARRGKGKTRIDDRARFMATPADMAGLQRPQQEASAERLGVRDVGAGVPIGSMVQGGRELLSSFEYVRIAILGPRAGKTSAVAIRETMETSGPSIITSNKRDIVDATRGPRSEHGVVRVHDVQNLVGEKPTWWWNPLSFVTNVERAERLAGVLVASATEKDAKTDAYFTTAAKQYLSALLLAAAVADKPMSTLLSWMSRPDVDGPVPLLAAAGFMDASRQLKAVIDLTPKQRDGVIGTAQPWVAFLRNPDYLPWIQKMGPDDHRPEFDPAAFVRSRCDALYLISKEGEGSARAITAALAMATLDAADRYGAESPGMRLPRPLTATLDEAANVVRWPELPDLYSHYGSRGIILSVFLQSWTQGREAWGEGGMKKMWSAANIRMVGSGVAEVDFLRDLSDLVGMRDKRALSSSSGRGGRSSSTSITTEKILDVSEIGAIPPMRALLFSSGNPATLVKLEPWWTKDYAPRVSASKDYYERLGAQGVSK